jgi:LPXTG-motif cell wall-anchored protein
VGGRVRERRNAGAAVARGDWVAFHGVAAESAGAGGAAAPLPRTGDGSAIPLTRVAAVLVAAGGALVFVARRRRHRRAAAA